MFLVLSPQFVEYVSNLIVTNYLLQVLGLYGGIALLQWKEFIFHKLLQSKALTGTLVGEFFFSSQVRVMVFASSMEECSGQTGPCSHQLLSWWLQVDVNCLELFICARSSFFPPPFLLQ